MTKKYIHIAAATGLGSSDFEMKEGAFAFTEEHMDAMEATLAKRASDLSAANEAIGKHAVAMSELATEKANLNTSLIAANAKVVAHESTISTQKATIDELNAKLESDPAENPALRCTGAEGAAGGKTGFFAEKFKKVKTQ